jgi:hypothetical protein
MIHDFKKKLALLVYPFYNPVLRVYDNQIQWSYISSQSILILIQLKGIDGPPSWVLYIANLGAESGNIASEQISLYIQGLHIHF